MCAKNYCGLCLLAGDHLQVVTNIEAVHLPLLSCGAQRETVHGSGQDSSCYRAIDGSSVFENGKKGPVQLRNTLAVLRAISPERGLDLAWRREVVKTTNSGRAILRDYYRQGRV